MAVTEDDLETKRKAIAEAQAKLDALEAARLSSQQDVQLQATDEVLDAELERINAAIARAERLNERAGVPPLESAQVPAPVTVETAPPAPVVPEKTPASVPTPNTPEGK